MYHEAPSTAPNYSSLAPGYDVAAYKREEMDTYDVLDHKQKKANISEPKADPDPVRDEISKKGDDSMMLMTTPTLFLMLGTKKRRSAD